MLPAARGIEPGALADAFAGVSVPWMLAGCACQGVMVMAQSLAWRLGLVAGGMGPVPLRHVVSANWIGQAGNALLPGRMGEAARVIVVRRHLHPDFAQFSRIAGSVVAQRVINAAACFVLVIAGVLSVPVVLPLPGGRWAALAALGGALALAAVARYTGLGRTAARALPARLRRAGQAFLAGAGLLRTGRAAAAAFALHLASLVAQLATVAFVLRGFGVAVPVSAALVVFVLLAVSSLVPAAPGGLGVAQVAIVAPLGAVYGVAANLALAFALGLQATVAAVAVTGGMAALVHQRLAHRAARARLAAGPPGPV
jgi:glycosyltransferase 2 family protein